MAFSLRWERRVEMFVGGGDGNARPTPMRGSRARLRRVHDGGEVGRVTMLTCLNGGTTRAVKRGRPARVGHRIYEKSERARA